jgi:hypothetical protein
MAFIRSEDSLDHPAIPFACHARVVWAAHFDRVCRHPAFGREPMARYAAQLKGMQNQN